jgi:hypothetical protein
VDSHQQPTPVQPVAHGSLRPRLPGTPTHPALTPELEAKHKESQKKFPNLSISAGEYVIQEVRRHPIGLLTIWAFVALLVLLTLGAVALYSTNQALVAQVFMTTIDALPSAALAATPALILSAFFVLGGVVGTIIYEGNKFYITSESIIQFIQTGLFTTKQQTVNLINVEDASSEQKGILQQVLNYGTLKLSTQGEETTYHFQYVSKPKKIVNEINDASERAVKILQGFPASEY